ncbi:MAG: FAD-dependent oxidoreductase [SAR324 cluster bacterium]|nr:FAD-dependent oxidoreductase [SAR324 cluster bacterium]
MKIAIIGSGISGMVAAYLLNRHHQITVFEANDYIGGHTHTVPVETREGAFDIDTGFIVYNEATYPNFIELLDLLEVETQQTSMSFSLSDENSGLEYSGTSLNSLFSQRKNFFKLSFYRMLKDILRFNREAPKLLEQNRCLLTLGEFLEENRYSREFREHYVIPMGAAIWSSSRQQIYEFPAQYFIQFFINHGLLNVHNNLLWRVIKGGSHQYIKKLTASYSDAIRLNTAIAEIKRYPDHVKVTPQNGESEIFDYVVIAAHSDQALRMLQDPTDAEIDILRQMPYQNNEVVLHTDSALMPRRSNAWSSWNYHLLKQEKQAVAVSYNMNILQNIKSDENFIVTLNYSEKIDHSKVIRRFNYSHPLFTVPGVAAQKRHHEISGVNRTYYCGAYWRYGFHEDGVMSALNVCEDFNETLKLSGNDHAKLHIRRDSQAS